MKSLNSDQLRARLQDNNCAMSSLSEENEEIVDLLAQRGLQMIEPKHYKEVPLTSEELKAGGWFCAPTDGNRAALRQRGIEYAESETVDGRPIIHEASCANDAKRVHKRGNNFYWCSK